MVVGGGGGGVLIIEESGYLQMCWDHHPFWLFAEKESCLTTNSWFEKKKGDVNGQGSRYLGYSWRHL